MGNTIKGTTDVNARHTQRPTEAKSAEKTNNRLNHQSEGCILERAASEGIQLHHKSKGLILERATSEGFQQQRDKNTSFDPNQAGNESDNDRTTSEDNQQSSKLNSTSGLFTVGSGSRSEGTTSLSNQQKLKEIELAHHFQADDEVADNQHEKERTTILVVQADKETENDRETSVDNQQKPNTSKRFALSNLRFDDPKLMKDRSIKDGSRDGKNKIALPVHLNVKPVDFSQEEIETLPMLETDFLSKGCDTINKKRDLALLCGQGIDDEITDDNTSIKSYNSGYVGLAAQREDKFNHAVDTQLVKSTDSGNKTIDEVDGQIEEKLSHRNEASNETEPDKCTSLGQTHDTSSSTSPENCKPATTLPSVAEIGTRMKSEVSQLTPLKKTEQPVTKSPVMVQESVHEHIEALQIQVRQLKEENESLKIRLCRFMSSKLTDNNPEITDLNDKNRPVELCQRYRELYNNEWTDAFEGVREVIGLSDKGGIKLLLDLIIDIYHMCEEKAGYDLKYLQEAISTFNAENIQDSDELTSWIKEQKDKRKKQFQKFLPELNKIALYITETHVPKEHIPESKLEPYVVLATELCWLMNIQDPPVYMETNFKKKAPFNKDLYCMFSCTGETNDYLVWPALFLQKDGPVLCKGYAAPRRYRQKRKKKHHLSKHKTIP